MISACSSTEFTVENSSTACCGLFKVYSKEPYSYLWGTALVICTPRVSFESNKKYAVSSVPSSFTWRDICQRHKKCHLRADILSLSEYNFPDIAFTMLFPIHGIGRLFLCSSWWAWDNLLWDEYVTFEALSHSLTSRKYFNACDGRCIPRIPFRACLPQGLQRKE